MIERLDLLLQGEAINALNSRARRFDAVVLDGTGPAAA